MVNMRFLKRILLILVLMSILMVINVGVVKASLQSNPNTHYSSSNIKDKPEIWMSNFRKMETAGETMGLSEVLNSDLTASSDSNGIDIHMIRSTEYGATAILSASAYGNSSNEQHITSTTGNDTGVMLNTHKWEFVAGGLEEKIFLGINGRYYDTYTTNQASARIGDALGNTTTNNPGCSKWHNVTSVGWITTSSSIFIRGLNGIFSFFNYPCSQTTFYCRGVAICGAGL